MVWCATGCITYSGAIRDAQIDLREGRPASALELVNEQLQVDEATDLPAELNKNKTLLLLERGTLLQALGEYELAARDMMIADQRLEWLDIDGSKSADLAKYLYSQSATPYRAPAYERLLLNTLNMVNFMAAGDFEDARVEARRFRIIEQFFLDDAGNPLTPELLASGNYLGGVAFEASREYETSVRYYARAWLYGYRPPELRERLVDLIRVTGWNGAGVATFDNGVEDLVVEAGLKGAMRAAEYRRRHVDSQVLAVVQTGLVPYKVPERIPIAQALVYSHHYHGHHSLTSAQRAQAHQLAVSGALKWVNFPVLSTAGLPHGRSATLFVDGKPVDMSHLANVANQVEEAYRSIAGALIGTAILRMMARAIAGGATRVGSQIAAEAHDAPAIGALGWLAGVAVEGALAAADVPDTRSWTTAPGLIQVARLDLEPGIHRLALAVDGRTHEQYVRVQETGLTVVNFSKLR